MSEPAILLNKTVKLDCKTLLKIIQSSAIKLNTFVHKLRDLYLHDTDFCSKIF